MAEKLNTEIRREQIIKASIKIISKAGLKALTIKKIGQEIGIVPSNVYRHFKGKGQIIDGVLDFIKQRFAFNLKQARLTHKEPLSILKGILFNQVKMMLNVSAVFPRLFLSDAIFTNQQLKERVLDIFDFYLGDIGEIFRKGQENKSIRNDICEKELAVMFMGLFQPTSFFFLLNDGQFDIEKQVKKGWLVFEAGIKI